MAASLDVVVQLLGFYLMLLDLIAVGMGAQAAAPAGLHWCAPEGCFRV